ncbi:ParB/RepB/Spo0J family partition protein [Streptomyces rectiviolaceus]|uniref:ParB-like N-terminal domain-containing protein n=1 Tax=Streptomyces rectiviolaceus TaxID=332591 RepID=A0ABP6NPA8_9ACTN
MAGRRTSLASLAGGKVDAVPGKSDPLLLTVALDKLHCTRFNPRRNFGTDEELTEFGHKLEQEQLQPAVVVSKGAYLALWPDEADSVGDASYVIANGERRYRASRMVGRDALEVVHREDVAKSRAAFLDAVQSENNDRKDLDPIERAIAIDTMVAELGGADQVAAYYGKTKGWVSQQRKLLKLTDDLQALISSGEMSVRVGRDIAGLPAEQQMGAWRQELDRRIEAKEQPRTPRRQPERFTAVNQPQAPSPDAVGMEEGALPAPERFTAVNQNGRPDLETVGQPSGGPPDPDRFTAVNRDRTQGGQPTAPEGDAPQVREPLPDLVGIVSMPFGKPELVKRVLEDHMTPDNLALLRKLLDTGS